MMAAATGGNPLAAMNPFANCGNPLEACRAKEKDPLEGLEELGGDEEAVAGGGEVGFL